MGVSRSCHLVRTDNESYIVQRVCVFMCVKLNDLATHESLHEEKKKNNQFRNFYFYYFLTKSTQRTNLSSAVNRPRKPHRHIGEGEWYNMLAHQSWHLKAIHSNICSALLACNHYQKCLANPTLQCFPLLLVLFCFIYFNLRSEIKYFLYIMTKFLVYKEYIIISI